MTTIDTHTVWVTFFPDTLARTWSGGEATLPQLAEAIAAMTAASKSKLPLLKLAKFGNKRSDKNCLRTDENVESVTGIEVEHDAGEIAFEAAIEIVRKAKLRALAYTSPSWVEGVKEKWRILLPLAQDHAPASRAELVARVNGLFDGRLTDECFVLSQTFYFGHVDGRTHRVEVIDGDFLDHRDDLKTGAVGKSTRTRRANVLAFSAMDRTTPARSRDEITELLEKSQTNNRDGSGNWHNSMLAATASMIGHGWSDDEIFDATEPYCERGWGDDDIAEMIQSGRKKWGAPDPGWFTKGGLGQIIKQATDATPQAKPLVEITAQPHDFPDETSLDQYDWQLGRHLLRGEAAGSVAPGGTGKSSDSIVEGLAMTSGRQLTHDTVPLTPLRVMLINLEDKRNTMNKRIAAAMKHHKLKKEDIGGRLFVLAKGEIKLKVAKQLRTGNVERNEQAIAALINLVIEHKIDVLSVDSFIRTHSVNENDNSAIQEVVECFEDIAEKANCGVHLWHHTRKDKGDGAGSSVESARGAKSFIDACRSVRVFETMSQQQGEKLGVENPRQYFRVYSGKRNFAPHIEDSHWYHIEGVKLMNGPSNYLVEGDNIGVVEKWSPPEPEELTNENITNIRNAVGGGQWREHVSAGMWVGKAIAEVLGLDPDGQREQIKTVLKNLLKENILKRVPGKTSDHKDCIFIVPGGIDARPHNTIKKDNKGNMRIVPREMRKNGVSAT